MVVIMKAVSIYSKSGIVATSTITDKQEMALKMSTIEKLNINKPGHEEGA